MRLWDKAVFHMRFHRQEQPILDLLYIFFWPSDNVALYCPTKGPQSNPTLPRIQSRYDKLSCAKNKSSRKVSLNNCTDISILMKSWQSSTMWRSRLPSALLNTSKSTNASIESKRSKTQFLRTFKPAKPKLQN